jgi:queuosine precursor transporter
VVKREARGVRVVAYIIAIVIANVITASFAPIHFGIFIVPAGTFIVGLTFILRDFIQNAIGRRATYGVIGLALLISAISSYLLGDTLMITAASAVSFALSEALDTEVYSRLKATLAKRVFFSGLLGGTVDSAVFVIIGLSPLGAGFLPWSAVPAAIIGQVVVKGVMQGIGALIVRSLYIKEAV